jgi:hypothetical protein
MYSLPALAPKAPSPPNEDCGSLPSSGRRRLAVGDAAASYDPIVARRITKALEDGVTAGRRIAERIDGPTISNDAGQGSMFYLLQFLQQRGPCPVLCDFQPVMTVIFPL